ncbi:MAG: cytochrome c3 family protein, partial [Bacteroidales bacterium]|nr:cytochrome c3 family protein [Bacteroidales bacterium]
HSYKVMTHSEFRITEIVQTHNVACISCHDDPIRFQLVSDTTRPDLAKVHSFIPNYKAHLKSVRCIECHTSQQDTLWVAHQILEKELAVKKCVECHSSNTMLMASLYKYQNLEARQDGFLNAVILNDSYVIGANRNYIFNIASIVLFGIALLGIAIHVYLRIKNR